MSNAMLHVIFFWLCLAVVGFTVGYEFGARWGFAACAALWVLAPQTHH